MLLLSLDWDRREAGGGGSDCILHGCRDNSSGKAAGGVITWGDIPLALNARGGEAAVEAPKTHRGRRPWQRLMVGERPSCNKRKGEEAAAAVLTTCPPEIAAMAAIDGGGTVMVMAAAMAMETTIN